MLHSPAHIMSHQGLANGSAEGQTNFGVLGRQPIELVLGHHPQDYVGGSLG